MAWGGKELPLSLVTGIQSLQMVEGEGDNQLLQMLSSDLCTHIVTEIYALHNMHTEQIFLRIEMLL